jgi:hypothetical protein
MNIIDQNAAGTVFSVGYQDNGNFHVLIFDNKGNDLSSFEINSIIEIDDESKPITGFFEPLVTCFFVSEKTELFIQVYHRENQLSYYFIHNYETKENSKIYSTYVDQCSTINFPVKSFYSEVTRNFTTFFRQGNAVTVSQDDLSNSWAEKITDSDFGSMYLIYEKALMVRSSNSILFFKINEETGLWEQYDVLNKMRGQIYYIKGNVRIQIITDEKIYFFLICRKSLKPRLENVMINFMKCSMMMIGKMVRFIVTFKTNEKGLTFFRRNVFHNFKVAISNTNYEGANGVNLKTRGQFAVGFGD